MRSIKALLVSVAVLVAVPAWADVRLPALFSDGMVLQQGAKTRIWGTADPRERIFVHLANQNFWTSADDRGRWHVTLAPLVGGTPVEMVVKGKNVIKVRNILIGEVWLASGEANMEATFAGTARYAKETAAFPSIRLFKVEPRVSDQPLDDVRGKWVECTPDTVRSFSQVAFFFGRELHQRLRTPVGLILACREDSRIESWVPPRSLSADADLKPVADAWAAHARDHLKPGQVDENIPGGTYNGMIAPLTHCAIRGAIWYQGESNVDHPSGLYRKLFPALIQGWRKVWNRGDFPFLFVQLPNHGPVLTAPADSRWADLREDQAKAQLLPNTGMAVTIDLGEAKDTQRINTLEMGKRLALLAQAKAYGRRGIWSGPVYESMTVEGNKIILKFAQAGTGLVARGDQRLKGFAIAGKDGKFVWADARIKGDTVIVWSDRVRRPAVVRYAWADNPVGNLYNNAGLPAAPFQTGP